MSNAENVQTEQKNSSWGVHADAVAAEDRKPLPKWAPISLLAVTTVALAVPIVLVRRQWLHAVAPSMKNTPPPLRRATILQNLGPGVTPKLPTRQSTVPKPLPVAKPASSPSPSISNPRLSVDPDDGFNGALYSVKAFGVATAIVSVGAVAMVWGVKFMMGVQDTEEFAQRMRHLILTRMPILSSRIYRSTKSGDNPNDWDTSSLSPVVEMGTATATSGSAAATTDGPEWSWPSVEERLRNAFHERGLPGWAEAVMRELEAEGKMEREKRGHA